MSKRVKIFLTLVAVLNIVSLIFIFIHFKVYSIPSTAMEDTLKVGDNILVDRIYYRNRKPQRGEIIVFKYPKDQSKSFTKRCIGIPGDIIRIKNKVLYLNNKALPEPYVKHIDEQILSNTEGSERDQYGPITVASGHYFVLGDNRDHSLDSRYWGQLDQNLLQGKALAIYWRGSEYGLTWEKIK